MRTSSSTVPDKNNEKEDSVAREPARVVENQPPPLKSHRLPPVPRKKKTLLEEKIVVL